ncbi:MAG: hypothetical protein WC711_03625 [Candidatus Staskawiczbacteria bacterium]|jgi:hypothetical protein
MPKTKNNKQKPHIKLILFTNKDTKTKIIPKIKNPHTKSWGTLINDSRNIPNTSDKQKKNKILDEVI